MAALAPALTGRDEECRRLARMLAGVRAGESAVLVIRGEAGIGKTALMNYCARKAAGCRVLRVAGIESEMELPFAALHQLCGPMMNRLSTLPEPQQRALQIAFGLMTGSAPDRFFVGLAVLSLLADAAGDEPLVCLIDDAQWLDEASSQVLGFVSRRLLAEAVMLLFAAREVGEARLFRDLPDVTADGLTDTDAGLLLDASVVAPLDQRVRGRIIAETHGNPLALLELPKGMTAAELAGFGIPSAATVTSSVEERFRLRIIALPESTRTLMLLAAADPTGDAALVWRAARALGVGRDAAGAAGADLLNISSGVRFRHPLVRSAAYAAGTAEDRSAAHRALALATDPDRDPERRAWHLALAVTGPDESVASELERAATKVRDRAGLSAAAALLQRAVELTPDAARRTDRALTAAQGHLQAGAFDQARGMLAEVEAAAADDLQRARAEQLKGQIEWAASSGRHAPVLLVEAARRLEPLNVALARETYLHALLASIVAGPLASPGGQLLEVSTAVGSLDPAAEPARPCDLLLDGLAATILVGRTKAQPKLRRAVDAFIAATLSGDDWLQWGILAQTASIGLWDFDSYKVLSSRQVELARKSGALSPLSFALGAHGAVLTWCGEFDAATELADERHAVNEVAGIHLATAHDLMLAGYRGRPSEAHSLLSATITDATARGEGFALQLAGWAAALLHNGLGQYEEALTAAQSATAEIYLPIGTQVVLPELIEAATRTGKPALAEDAMVRLSEMTAIEGSDWAAGIRARCRALLSERAEAEQWYDEAMDRLGRTPLRPDLARARLLYGEWLRRQNRRVDARQQLRLAHETFVDIGAEGFAERARRELVATGERVRRRTPDARNDLTPQEARIARLALDGRTNTEIGAQLFLSVRTVEWHLSKVFTKLGIGSRRELNDAMPRPRR